MTANDSKSYRKCFNKLVDEYSNTYHRSTGKTHSEADYSALPEEIEKNTEAPKFKVGCSVTITNYKNIFSKGYTGNWWKEVFVTDSVFKTNWWRS